MKLPEEYEEFGGEKHFTEFGVEENTQSSRDKRRARILIEEKMEQKRLRAELEDELDAEFNWDDYKDQS